MFPGVAPSELGTFLKELQAAKITDKDALSELAGRLAAATGAEARKDAFEWARWESERDDFISFMESLPRTEVQIGPLTESLASKAKEMEALQKGLQSVAIGGRATLTAEGSVILAPGFRYVEIKVLNNFKEPIQGASVAIVQQNKTVLQQITGSDGIATIRVKLGAPVTILCARKEFASYIKTNFDSKQDLVVNLTPDNRIGSAIFSFGTGELPFLAGRLDPIRDTLGRTWLYADNIAIEGGKQQPVPIELNKPLLLEDADGNRCEVIFRQIIGRCSIMDYYLSRDDRWIEL